MATLERPPIRILATDVAARIAAGEVIERPASVVKELVENALDAGARRIDVLVEGGGLERIRVADDGWGIPADQLELAFARHGTSKIQSDDDLRRLATLGFRGEALPSIAAVAEVSCQTRAAEEPFGSAVRLRGGRIVERRAAARQPGTTVVVEELFADLPARRKFLRSRAAEAGLIAQVVAHLALARADVAMRLITDGRQVFATPGDGRLESAALAVRGPSFLRGAHHLGPLVLRNGAGHPIAELEALLGPASEQRPNRSGLSLFVNRRWVHNRALLHAVEEGYRTFLRTGRYPSAIVLLTVPPETVDVNVHPAKSEVRLLHERELYGPLYQAVARALPEVRHHGAAGGDDAGPELAGLAADDLRVLGQVGGTYIVVEGRQGLYLVDQHAAHERVLLEELQTSLAVEGARQPLIVPEVIDRPPLHGADLEELSAILQGWGFESEAFGPDALLIRSVPAVLAARRPLEVLAAALESLGERTRAAWRDQLGIELACRSAVRAGDALAPEEMAALVRRLGEARLGEACAHGRPTAILLSHGQLARQFGRA